MIIITTPVLGFSLLWYVYKNLRKYPDGSPYLEHWVSDTVTSLLVFLEKGALVCMYVCAIWLSLQIGSLFLYPCEIHVIEALWLEGVWSWADHIQAIRS